MYGGHWGRELNPRTFEAPRQLTNPSVLKLQHRLVLGLLVDSFTDLRQPQRRKFGHHTPAATSVHQYNLTGHQHEVTEPALFGVHAVELLSDGGPCEGFRDTLEDDRA